MAATQQVTVDISVNMINSRFPVYSIWCFWLLNSILCKQFVWIQLRSILNNAFFRCVMDFLQREKSLQRMSHEQNRHKSLITRLQRAWTIRLLVWSTGLTHGLKKVFTTWFEYNLLKKTEIITGMAWFRFHRIWKWSIWMKWRITEHDQ